MVIGGCKCCESGVVSVVDFGAEEGECLGSMELALSTQVYLLGDMSSLSRYNQCRSWLLASIIPHMLARRKE